MRCLLPFIKGTAAYPCGKCLPCLKYRARVWSHRILLEASLHERKSFVTLTYGDEHLPEGGSLRPSDLQAWLKRLRKRSEPACIRFYACGEYGDRSWRPHYHAALFGYPSCSYGPFHNGVCECTACLGVRETWRFGHIMVAPLTVRSAQYIAGYVTKKMTSERDERLCGRHPEFARMSRRPGIGVGALWDVASGTMRYDLKASGVLRYGKQELKPFGRFLSRKLKEYCGEELVAGVDPEVQLVSDFAEALCPTRGMAKFKRHVVDQLFAEFNSASEAQIRKERTQI